MIWIVLLWTIGLDSCLGKLMVDLVGISRVSHDLAITKCLIPLPLPDNLTLGHIPASGRHLPSLAFTSRLNQLTTPAAIQPPHTPLPSHWINTKTRERNKYKSSLYWNQKGVRLDTIGFLSLKLAVWPSTSQSRFAVSFLMCESELGLWNLSVRGPP